MGFTINSRFRLTGVLAGLALSLTLVSTADADHRRHWFYDSYNQYDDDAFTYYAPERWQRRRDLRREDPDYLYEEGYISEREYWRLLRAERRKARRLRAKRRALQQRKRWRERRIHYDLARKKPPTRILKNVPLPRPRPFDSQFATTTDIQKPVETETATLGNSPLTVAPTKPAVEAEQKPVTSTKSDNRPKAVEKPKPVKNPKPVKENTDSITTAALPPVKPAAPAKPAVKKPVAKKERPVKGRISCANAQDIVAGFGFTDIETKTCSGKSYAFAAKRDGKAFTISLSSKTGELTEVKRN